MSYGRVDWCFVADSNRGSPACRAGASAAKLTKRVVLAPGLEPGNVGVWDRCLSRLAKRASRTGLVWRLVWCTREDLNLHALSAAASEAAASAVSPRVRDWCRNGGSNAGFRLTKAVPCHWTIAAKVQCWCWLEDSNPTPLAYKASALPDELSQLLQIDKRIAAPLPVWKRACLNGPEIRRRVQFWTFTMSKSAAPTGTVVMRKRTNGQEHAQTRARPTHMGRFWMFCGS